MVACALFFAVKLAFNDISRCDITNLCFLLIKGSYGDLRFAQAIILLASKSLPQSGPIILPGLDHTLHPSMLKF